LRRSARIDSNQPEIVAALRKRGAVVVIVSTLKNFCDIIVFYNGRTHIVEIKDGNKPRSATKLTEGEQRCKYLVESVGVPYNVVYSVEDALELLK